MADFSYTLQHSTKGSRARAGLLQTTHATIQTPVFMPVGTQATVRSMRAEDLEAIGFNIILANTYHLLLRPGPEVFRQFGGIHHFAKWPRAVLTDSGGFQIFSLPGERRITEDGAIFRSYVDGTKFMLSPETSIAMQKAIGSDIMMVLDECVPSVTSKDNAQRAMELTHRWAMRSLQAREESQQALFAIVQGACFEDLRRESAAFLTDKPFDGFAIGGLAVGETKDEREQFTEFVANLLPPEKPRYLMGVGTPIDLLEAVNRGVDMFDCIIPTSHAQQGLAYTHKGLLKVQRGVYKFDDSPIASDCKCRTCQKYSRAYIHHLIKANEGLGWTLMAWHNLYFYHELMTEMRGHILADTFADYYREKRQVLALSDVETPDRVSVPKAKKHESLGKYRIVLTESGQGRIQHIESMEIMHPEATPNQEAEELYVEKSSLIHLLTAEDEVIVWDVGLGVAHNAMAAIRCAESLWSLKPECGSTLRIVSFENDLDPLRLGNSRVSCFNHLKHPAPHVVLRDTIWRSKDGRAEWSLRYGDFTDELEKQPPAPHVVFFDPFSSKVDCKLWTFQHFEQLSAKLSERPVILVTYSCSTAIRAAMLGAGFYLYSVNGTGKRREATVATNQLEWQRQQNGQSVIDYSLLRPLDDEWLGRWTRSSNPAPADISATQLDAFRSLVIQRWEKQNRTLPAKKDEKGGIRESLASSCESIL